ncbi:Sjogren's syndrome/scleroderma autoantigen 1 family protein [Halopenitus sp. H-Gu1]|uniref:Sjogren's syndrome/scleroderma autoantigen 1 family protein n=1 Tax=Halopenitus sp. H-Gu1 TaxID=3242697 RepID=UPI00359E5773
MSNDFDKEAEREKLREKYERDQEKREHTQHMSELLLKGATMTNSHCDTCGDPIFRHDGQEFCPTCAREDAATGAESAATGAEDGTPTQSAESAGGSHTESADGSSNGPTEAPTGATREPTQATGGPAGVTGEPPRAMEGSSQATNPAPAEADRSPTESAGPSPNASTEIAISGEDAGANGSEVRTGSDRPGSTPSEDLQAAHGSLTRTVRRFAEAAEQADDPHRAREHLEAVREAAEALSALDR